MAASPRIDVTPPTPIERLLTPFQRFAHDSSSGGLVLIACAVIALVWANSAWGDTYTELWNWVVTVGPEGYELSKPLILWINDGLMAIFFFYVGLEIKREVLVGELSTGQKAAFPLFAAVGGMLAPALIYVAINLDGALNGWAIPSATDIAFALGILALLGPRVPVGLKVFLTAFAIVDDIGAVLVIALFYTTEIALGPLVVVVIAYAVMLVGNRLGIRRPSFFAIVGLIMWIAVLKSGVHATVAGILAAFAVPARRKVDLRQFTDTVRDLLNRFTSIGVEHRPHEMKEDQRGAINALERVTLAVQSPAHRLEEALHPWVAFVVMPVFALANAGVAFAGNIGVLLLDPITVGVAAGLFFGNQIGIMFFTWLAERLGLATMPAGVTRKQLYGASILGGVGFTMSLFVSSLAFSEAESIDAAKVGILLASLLSGLYGYFLLRSTLPASTEVS